MALVECGRGCGMEESRELNPRDDKLGSKKDKVTAFRSLIAMWKTLFHCSRKVYA